MRKYLFGLAVLVCLIQAGDALATSCAFKTWTTGETVKATDLNSNFSCTNNAIGLGSTLTNTNVASNAAIAHSKMATPALLPKAWGVVGIGAACNGAAAAGTACTVNDSSQVYAVSSNGTTGEYRIRLNNSGASGYSPPNANYAVIVTSLTSQVYCVVDTGVLALQATTGDANGTNFVISCETDASADNNAVFSFIVMDT